MQRIIHVWLQPAPAQTVALQQTLETVNAARNEISAVAWYTATFATRALYELSVEEVGTRFGLSRAMTRRSVASVAAGYREQRPVQQRFHPLQSIPYDRHTLRIDGREQTVTLWTLIGWQSIALVTDAPFLEGWSLPSLMRFRGMSALLLVVPDMKGD